MTCKMDFPFELNIPAAKLKGRIEIGEGGFGVVYEATHDDWGKVAYKKLQQNFISKANERQLVKESLILKDLRHQNIIRMMGIVFETNDYGIVFEYVRHRDMKTFLNSFHIDWPLRVKWTYDVGLAMNYLHTLQKPIIHGDLKIQNVLIGDGYHAKICDFGLSTWKQMSTTKSRKSSLNGTVTHVPPEKWRNMNLKPDEKFDVYSFSVLVWEIFTQEIPFHGADPAMIMAAVSTGQRPDEGLLSTELPPFVRQIIVKNWDQEPEKRSTFKEIKEELEKIVDFDKSMQNKITKTTINVQEQEKRQFERTSSNTSLECDGFSTPVSMATEQPQLPEVSTATGMRIQQSVTSYVQTNDLLPVVRNTENPTKTDYGTNRVDVMNNQSDMNKDELMNNELAGHVRNEEMRMNNELGMNNEFVNGESPRIVNAESSLCQRSLRSDQSSNRVHSTCQAIQECHGLSFNTDDSADDRQHWISLHSVRQVSDLAPRMSDSAPRMNDLAPRMSDSAPRMNDSASRMNDSTSRMNDSTSRSIDSALRLNRSDFQIDEEVTKSSEVKKENSSGSSRHKNGSMSLLTDLEGISLRSDFPSKRNPHEKKSPTPGVGVRAGQPNSTLETDAIESPDAERTWSTSPHLSPLSPPPPPSPPPSLLSRPAFQSIDLREAEKSSICGIVEMRNEEDDSGGGRRKEEGYFPKDGTSFQRHSPRNQEHERFDFRRLPSRDELKRPADPDPPRENRGSLWDMPKNDRGSKAKEETTRNEEKSERKIPSDPNQPSLVYKKNGAEVRVYNVTGANGLQIGDNNVMYVNTSQRKEKATFQSRERPAPASCTTPTTVLTAPKKKQVKITVPDKLVDGEVMSSVSALLAKDWVRLGRFLGFSESDIDALTLDHDRWGVKETAYQMLREWREKRGPEAKMNVLATALVAIKRHDIALKLSKS